MKQIAQTNPTTIPDDDSIEEYYHAPPQVVPARCPDCGIYFTGMSWGEPRKQDKGKEYSLYRCPGCRMVRDGYYRGEFCVPEEFVVNHTGIEHRIDTIVRKHRTHDLEARIVNRDNRDGFYLIQTTNVSLAEKIAKNIAKKYGGTIDSHHGTEVSRFVWHNNN